MTSLERIKRAFTQTPQDRTPRFEYVMLSPAIRCLMERTPFGDRFRDYTDYSDMRAQWQEMKKELGTEGALKKYAQWRVDLAIVLGHDAMLVNPNPSSIAYPPLNITHSYDTSDPGEELMARNLYNEASVSRVPDDSFLIYHILKEEMRRREVELAIIAPLYFHGIWTDTSLMQAMILAPDAVHRHYELATERAFRYLKYYIEAGVELCGIGGDFAGNRMIISPESYRTFIVPEVRRVSDAAREAGIFTINASDGNLWDVLDDFLFGCGADGYIEIDAGAGMDLWALREKYGGKITFFGNIDCGTLLSFTSPEDIRETVFKCLDDGCGTMGGHVFCASNAIVLSIPAENYFAMHNAYNDYFSLPRLDEKTDMRRD